MVKDIVFHLGDCKTGSTSIQHALATKAWRAEGAKVIYPLPRNMNHIYLSHSLRHADMYPLRTLYFRSIRKEIRRSSADHAAMSSEHFEYTDPAALRRAIEKYLPDQADNIRLIAYVRPHAERLMSAFVERAKKGNARKSPKDLHKRFLATKLLYYAPRFEKWRTQFGDRFELRPMIRARLRNQDVVEDFFDFLFQGAPFELTGRTEANKSLSVEDLALMREMHKRIRSRNPNLRRQQDSLGWNLSPLLVEHAADKGTKPRLHRGLVRNLQSLYRDDAAALDAGFFDGTPMSDALEAAIETAVDAPQSYDAHDYFSDRELGHVHAFSDFIQRLIEASPESFHHAGVPSDQRGDYHTGSKPPNARMSALADWAKRKVRAFRRFRRHIGRERLEKPGNR